MTKTSTLHVHNTLTKRLEPFVTLQPKVARIYTCGLTVYAPMHIGHARTYCFWDLFRRYLEYRGYHVMSVINYTDIDDRIIARAQAKEGGPEGPVDLAERNIALFRGDCRKLHIKDYAVYTRATDFVAEQVSMVQELIDKGHAYATAGEVFYGVDTYPPYGQLSGRKLEEQEVGASGRVDKEDLARKRNPADFTLWKPSDAGVPSWPTDAKQWPSGLFKTPSHDEARGFFATQHYRAKLPFSWALCAQASQGYARIKKLVSVLAGMLGDGQGVTFPPGLYASQRDESERVPRLRHQYVHGAYSEHTKTFLTRFMSAMDDDLNTPNAIAALFDYVSALYAAGIEKSTDKSSLAAVYRTLTRHLWVFGVEIAEPALYPELVADCAQAPEAQSEGRGGDAVLDRLLEMRREARAGAGGTNVRIQVEPLA